MRCITITLLIVIAFCGILGHTDMIGPTEPVARILFYVFIVLLVVSVLLYRFLKDAGADDLPAPTRQDDH